MHVRIFRERLLRPAVAQGSLALALAVFLALPGVHLHAQDSGLVTNTFQNGVQGYAGQVAASISTQYAADTEGNGVTTLSGELLVWKLDYEERALLRFGDLNLPPAAEVQTALLDLTFENWDAGISVAGYYLKSPWDPTASGNQGLGWLHRAVGADWSAAGASGVGTDVLAGSGFTITGFQGLGDEPKTVALDPAVVQTWVSALAADQGVLLVANNTNSALRVHSADDANVAFRPRLTIVYRPGVSPTIAQAAAATPNPVAGTTSLLSVLGAWDSGETNLAYTWSAVGKPPGAADPQFSPDGSNAAKQSTATYARAGDYLVQAVVRSPNGLTATSTVQVEVQPVFSAIGVLPTNTAVVTNATQSFAASAWDQFGDPLPAQPSFGWSVDGGGSIDGTGLFTAAGTPGGPYTVRAQAGGKTGSASVRVRLPNVLPSVRLTSPAAGQVFLGRPLTGWADLPLAAEASDADGSVTKVEFYAGASKLGEAGAPPYTLVWSNAAPGAYGLTARAWDNDGAVSTSAVVAVTVQTPPSPVQPFFAAAQHSGTLEIKLYATEGVTGNRLVTFGVPFPRGSVGPADLGRVRVLSGGTEIPAYVDALSLWRQARNPAVDGASIRVARIQIHHQVSASWPNADTIAVEWGTMDRALNVATLEDPRSAWHGVTNGTFQAADRVFEPDVLPVLPKSYLCLGLLKPARLAPLDDSIPETREDPAAMAAIAHWPGYLELDHAVHNFFFSLINQDDPRVSAANQCPYRTDYEPWLYDRASAMFLLYFRSGHVQALREAIRATDFYRSQLYPLGTDPVEAVGLFRLKEPTPPRYAGGNGAMYSYDECLAYDYWLCGDAAVLPAFDLIVSAHELNDEPTRWAPDATTFTERHTGFRLLANVIAYEVLGRADCRSNLLSQAADFIWDQNGAGGLLPSNRVDGGLYHFGSQHGDGDPTNLVASSWMTAVTLDAMLHTFAVTEDPDVASFISRLGTFWKATCKTSLDHEYDTYDGALLFPDYMMTYDGTSDPFDGRDYGMVEHALDVGSGLAWSGYFAALLGRPDISLAQTATNLYYTYDIGVNYWTRPAGPAAVGNAAFRVSPWRKYGWEHRLSGSFPWLLNQLPLDESRPRLSLVPSAPNRVGLGLSGASGVWRIETSATLTNWTTAATVTNAGSATFVDLPAPDSHRFYRAVVP